MAYLRMWWAGENNSMAHHLFIFYDELFPYEESNP